MLSYELNFRTLAKSREPGWDLPERRKYRYRIEDVAY
jgi:hypothetical protein